MAYDVFISYATEDVSIAQRVCQILESRGLACWMAPRDVPPGTEWAQAIVKAIQSVKALVLVFSDHANASPAIRRELDRAFAAGIPVFPFRIKQVEPSGSIALYIAGVQWIDALTPPMDAQIARLAAAILPMVGDVRPCPPPTPLPASPQPHRSWRLGIAAVAACLVLAAVILLMLRPELGSWAGGKKSSNQPEAGPSSGQAEKPIARVTAPLPAPQPKASPSGRQAKKPDPGTTPTHSVPLPPAHGTKSPSKPDAGSSGGQTEKANPGAMPAAPASPPEPGPSIDASKSPNKPNAAPSLGNTDASSVPPLPPPPEGIETDVPALFRKLLPLHKRLAESAGDQTYSEYLKSGPTQATGQAWRVYVQSLGEFGLQDRKIVALTSQYLHGLCDLPEQILDDLPIGQMPAHASRSVDGKTQLSANYLLQELLQPKRPKDAAFYLVFTKPDLWPGKGPYEDWNYCFGQATYTERVGVWSLCRYGDPSESDLSFRTCLLRTLKIASTLTCNMFSLTTCKSYKCNMNQVMSVAELDEVPLWLCPRCHAKLYWAVKHDPARQLERLAAFCKEQGLAQEQEFFAKSLAAIREGR